MAEATPMIIDEAVPTPPRPALRSLPQPVDLSILIVTWNSERWIDRCLRSIDEACDGIAYEVLVYDNASCDATLTRIGDDVHVIRANANDGFAAGTNRALAQSRGRFVFFLNPDCELAPKALTLLVNFLEQNPHAAAAAPLLDDEIGELDEQFQPAWFEDVDFCKRLAAAGKPIYAVPAARARHFGGASLEHVGLGRFVDVWYRNMWLYARKWFTPGEAETLRWLIISGMLLRCIASLAGFANGNGRLPSMRAYANVAKKALKRWDDWSPSSS